MCGICGVFHFNGNSNFVDSIILDKMRDTMVHRGPDGQGTWISSDRRVGLGHRRLSIIDLSPSAAQPMANEDGTVWVTFNGEIYNHVSLRKQLSASGHRFRTDHSDTEAIVHGYEEWGGELLDRLEGKFSIGIWDQRRRQLFLARDRLGVKPLYFSLRPGLFLFASEIKAILAHPESRAELCSFAMYHYLSFLTTPAPMTMFQGIYKLPAGWSLLVEESGKITPRQYWDCLPRSGSYHPELDHLSERAQEDFCIRTTRSLLTQAIEKRMMSDVPFGVFLSGGIDSTTNVALMSQYTSLPVKTFTVGFKDHSYLNELEYARLVARHFRTDHHEVLVSESQMVEYLPQMIYSQDEPIADWVCIPLYFVSRLARQNNTIVVQVGEGSDEQFCGYDGYMGYLRLYHRYWRPFQQLPKLSQHVLAAGARLVSSATDRWDTYIDIIDRASRSREHFWGGVLVFEELGKQRLLRQRCFNGTLDVPGELSGLLPPGFLSPDSFNVVAYYLAECDRVFPGADVLTRMTYLELKLRLPELLLMRVDKISMSTSIEARVPFLDHKLVEFTMGLPMRIKVQNGVPKSLLKKCCEGIIPDEIIHRKKMGFGAPMREWLRGDFGNSAQATIMGSHLRKEGFFDYSYICRMFDLHRQGRDCSKFIWALYNLTAWFDRWIAGQR